MRIRRVLLYVGALMFLLLFAAPVMMASPAKTRSTSRPKAPAISPRATELVHKMSEYLAGLNKFQFEAETSKEVIIPAQGRVDVLARVDVSVQRPNKLYVGITRANRDRQFFYDGKTFTVYSPSTKYYAVAPAPPTIDQMLDSIDQYEGITFPLEDLLYANVEKTLMPDVRSGTYIGPSIVNGFSTQQLQFRQKDADWQLWIEDGNMPVPRRLVITDRGVTGEPGFTATMTKWNVAPTFSESTFTFTPPAGAKKIQFLKPRRAR